jgi:hypothetical protein
MAGQATWQLAERMTRHGYDMFTALEHAGKFIQEFQASGEYEREFAIMGSHGKAAEVILIRNSKVDKTSVRGKVG